MMQCGCSSIAIELIRWKYDSMHFRWNYNGTPINDHDARYCCRDGRFVDVSQFQLDKFRCGIVLSLWSNRKLIQKSHCFGSSAVAIHRCCRVDSHPGFCVNRCILFVLLSVLYLSLDVLMQTNQFVHAFDSNNFWSNIVFSFAMEFIEWGLSVLTCMWVFCGCVSAKSLENRDKSREKGR